MSIPSKQAIVEVASTSGDRDILYSYVAIENDHTVATIRVKRDPKGSIGIRCSFVFLVLTAQF